MSHYFDHAATTPMRECAITAWESAVRCVGNASAIHGAGRASRAIVEESREMIAQDLGVAPTRVVFTSGGSEANNIAILGTARARVRADGRKTIVLVNPVEHPAAWNPVQALASEGFTIMEMPFTERGAVNLAATADLMRLHADDLALAVLMAVNNETGIIQPAADLAGLAAELGVSFHCDMVQAHGHGPALGDGTCSAAFAAHKLGGPMGVGALILPSSGRTSTSRDAVSSGATGMPSSGPSAARGAIEPIGFGGGQEADLRSGTVPTPLIASFAAALREGHEQADTERARCMALSSRLFDIICASQGIVVGMDAQRTPEITYALFPGCAGQDLVVLLDAVGVYVSNGSACRAGVPRPGRALLAMGCSEDEALSGLRFSLGWSSSDADLNALEAALPDAVRRARR